MPSADWALSMWQYGYNVKVLNVKVTVLKYDKRTEKNMYTMLVYSAEKHTVN